MATNGGYRNRGYESEGERRPDMLLGPVHLVVLALDNDKMRGQIARELHSASQRDLIRVLDALAIRKTDTGSIISLGVSDLTLEQRMAYGAIVGALLGFGPPGTQEAPQPPAQIA